MSKTMKARRIAGVRIQAVEKMDREVRLARNEMRALRQALDDQVMANASLRATLQPLAAYYHGLSEGVKKEFLADAIVVSKGTLSTANPILVKHIKHAAHALLLPSKTLADIERTVQEEVRETTYE